MPVLLGDICSNLLANFKEAVGYKASSFCVYNKKCNYTFPTPTGCYYVSKKGNIQPLSHKVPIHWDSLLLLKYGNPPLKKCCLLNTGKSLEDKLYQTLRSKITVAFCPYSQCVSH